MAGQDAYVPGHSHDLFVSYAWMDNQIPGTDQPEDGWVHGLVSNLRILLAAELGRANRGEVWIDKRIDRTQAITPELEAALDSSAAFLMVLSKGWLESPWCPYELDRFVSHKAASGGAAGRIFVVHKTWIDPERRPEPIRDLIGYDLYQINRDGRERQLGFPVPLPKHPDDREYFNRLFDLSRKLADRLEELRTAASAAPAQAPVPPDLAPQPQTAASPAAPAASSSPKAVYVAEVHRSLQERRDVLGRQLAQSGLVVRPANLLPGGPADYRDAVAAELAQSLLFVQLLGLDTMDKRPDLPQGHEALQLELARAAGLPILRWLDPLLDQAKLDDPALFAAAEVQVCGFEDFKRRVEGEARRLLIPPPNLPDTDTQVLIRASAADEQAAYGIGATLYAQGIGYEVAEETVPLADLVERAPYQGLMVVYDQCDRAWARQQVNDCRVIAMARKSKAPACAVYDAPREGKAPLGMMVRHFHWLRGLGGPDLGPYLDALAQVAVP